MVLKVLIKHTIGEQLLLYQKDIADMPILFRIAVKDLKESGAQVQMARGERLSGGPQSGIRVQLLGSRLHTHLVPSWLKCPIFWGWESERFGGFHDLPQSATKRRDHIFET